MGISAQELRIGNIVDTVNHGNGITSPNKQPMWIQAIELHSIELCNVKDSIHDTRRFLRKPLSDIIPIPLTEELLLKLGFNQEGSDFTKEFRVHADCYSQLIITIDQKKAMIYMSTPDGDCNNAYLSFPNFVHQLQNLFYSICGDELTIK